MTIPGIDVSRHQGHIDWLRLKAAQIVAVVWIRATLGAVGVDERFAENWAGATDNHWTYPQPDVGVYHYYVTEAAPLAQLANLLGVTGGDFGTAPLIIDCEPRADEVEKAKTVPFDRATYTRNLRTFLQALVATPELAAHGDLVRGQGRYPRALMLYGNEWSWRFLTTLPTWAGDYAWDVAGYSLTASEPALPPGVTDWQAWQYWNKGDLPGVDSAVDLQRVKVVAVPNVFDPPEVPMIASGSKFGMHAIRPGQVIPLVRQAQARGVVWPLVKAVDNGGVAIDVKAIEPRTRTITRFVNISEDAAQNVETWTPADMRVHARAALDAVWGRLSPAERAAADWIEPINEADPPGVAGWRAFGEYLKVIVDEGNSRGMRLALPAFNAGTPEWDECQALVATGIFGLMRAGGHILTIHEGVFGAAAVTDGWPGGIPGAPVVPGAGPLCFRYRFLYSLLAARGEVVPLVVSEFYAGGSYRLAPAEQVARFAWYDRECRKDPYVLAVLPFTIDPDDTWRQADYTYAYGAVLDYLVAEKDIPNATEGDAMPITKAEKQALLDQANALATTAGTQLAGANALIGKIAAIVPDDVPPAWKVGDVAIAVTNPFQLYTPTHTPAGLPRPNYNSDQNVLAVSADGQWLKVFAAPEYWVKASEVRHK